MKNYRCVCDRKATSRMIQTLMMGVRGDPDQRSRGSSHRSEEKKQEEEEKDARHHNQREREIQTVATVANPASIHELYRKSHRVFSHVRSSVLQLLKVLLLPSSSSLLSVCLFRLTWASLSFKPVFICFSFFFWLLFSWTSAVFLSLHLSACLELITWLFFFTSEFAFARVLVKLYLAHLQLWAEKKRILLFCRNVEGKKMSNARSDFFSYGKKKAFKLFFQSIYSNRQNLLIKFTIRNISNSEISFLILSSV